MKLPMTLLAIAAFALAGCGGDEASPAPGTSAPKPPPPPPPNYTAGQVEKALLTPAEIGTGIQEIRAIADALKNGSVPVCSLAATKVQGDPELTTRQFSSEASGKDEVKYTQVIARFDTPQAASSSYSALREKVRSCPGKQHVPAKRIRKDFVLYSHDDTWRVSEDKFLNWSRLRGTEQQKYSSSTTKYNVLHVLYDYALRGNLVVASMYYERMEPKRPGDPIVKRATEVLTKQLGKIG